MFSNEPKATGKIAAAEYHFFLYEEIGCPEDYVEMIDTLVNAGENDYIFLHLNGPGGRLDSTIAIVHAIAQCDGTVVASADGPIASAHTLIFFACEACQIGEYSTFMIHQGSGGEIGYIHNNATSAAFSEKQISKLYDNIYGPFFTKNELKKIKRGEDMYLDAENVAKRIEKKMEEAASDEEAMVEALLEEIMSKAEGGDGVS